MERHRCKLGWKNFPNGKALGGNMRSHMLNLYVPPKTEQLSESPAELDLVSSSSEEEIDDKGLFGYGLKENPKKSVKLLDPKFSGFQVSHDHHQTESETESSKNLNLVRRRSKRVRKSGNFEPGGFLKKPELVKLSTQTELVDSEPVSSISDTSPDEDVANCLMMLSRDKWYKEKDLLVYYDDDKDEEDQEQDREEDYYEQSENESDHEEKVIKKAKAKGKYRCDTCNKVFKSYQALGGHRASHKKIRLNHNKDNHIHHGNSNASLIHDLDREIVVEEKIHECPVCFRVFASGQALGGHKRTHVIGSSSATIGMGNNAGFVHAKPVAKQEEMSLIDLNLPAPMEDEDDNSQIELSAVSDGEFVKIH